MSARRLGAVLALGVLLALVIDLVLQAALYGVRIGPSRGPWEAALATKSVWLLAIGFAAGIAPAVLPIARKPLDWAEAGRIAGVMLIAAPLIWTAATVLVLVARWAITSSWGRVGELLLEPSLYSEIVTTNGPWLLAGSVLKVVARHAALRGVLPEAES